VVKIWQDQLAGRRNIRRVGGNQSDFGCPKAGRLREYLSFLGEIKENRAFILPILSDF
jgi:hypothetical protein